jgi:hypothetical protein
MHTFTKTRDPENRFDHTEVTVKTSAEQLSDIVAAFEDYLRATGFHFEGQRLELVDDEACDLPGEDA